MALHPLPVPPHARTPHTSASNASYLSDGTATSSSPKFGGPFTYEWFSPVTPPRSPRLATYHPLLPASMNDSVAVEAPVDDTLKSPMDPMADDTTLDAEGATESTKRITTDVETTAWPGGPPAKKAKTGEENTVTIEVDANVEDDVASPATITEDPSNQPHGKGPPVGQAVEASNKEETTDIKDKEEAHKEEADKEESETEATRKEVPPTSNTINAMCVTVPNDSERAKTHNTALMEAALLNVNGAVTSAFSGKSLRFLLGSPVTALDGMESEGMVTSANSIWDNIGALATWKPLNAARALSEMAKLLGEAHEEHAMHMPSHVVRFGMAIW